MNFVQCRAEVVRLNAALAAEKEEHGKTFERLVNVGNVAEQMATLLRSWNLMDKPHEKADTLLAAYDEFRTATKPEEAE
jgi:hypothetical protein